MATLLDTVRILQEFGKQFDINAATASAPPAAPAIAPTPSVSPVADARPGAYDFGKRVGTAVRTGGGWLSRLLQGTAGAAIGVQGASDLMSDAAPTSQANAIINTGLGVGSLVSPVARVAAPVKLAMDAGLEGIAAAGEAQYNKKNPVLAPAFAQEVQKAGGAGGYVKSLDDKRFTELAAQDAAADKFAKARKARVDQVIQASQAGRAEDAKLAEVDEIRARRAALEEAKAAVPLPDFSLAGSFAGLNKLLQQTAQYVNQRGQLNTQARQAFASEEKALDRLVDREKIDAALMGKLAEKKDDIKLGTVKTLSGEASVAWKNGVPTLSTSMDDQGNVTVRQVRAAPSEADARKNALEEIKKASNPAAEKLRWNELFKKYGWAPL